MLESLRQQVDALSLRERVIVLLAALAVIYGLWYLVWMTQASGKREALKQELAVLERERGETQAQLDTYRRITGGSALAEKRAERDRAQQRLAELDEQLAQLTHGLVGADQLAEVLRDMLNEAQSLTLHSLSTEPVQRVQIDAPEGASATDSGVYRHTVTVEVSGRYFEILQLLRRLEALNWRFYWESLDYEVASYPEGRVSIRVFTLSAEEGRLGV